MPNLEPPPEPAAPTYYKATRPNGRDFRTNTVQYRVGKVTQHPDGAALLIRDHPWTYLSVATRPEGTLLGVSWPLRLFRVEAVGQTVGEMQISPFKVGARAVRVREEVEAHLVFGPNGPGIVRVLERLMDPSVKSMMDEIVKQLSMAWNSRGKAPNGTGLLAWMRGAVDDEGVVGFLTRLDGDARAAKLAATLVEDVIDQGVHSRSVGYVALSLCRAVICLGYPTLGPSLRSEAEQVVARTRQLGPFMAELAELALPVKPSNPS